MTGTELKEALQNGRKVIANLPNQGNVEFACVSAVVYRKDEKGRIKVSAELFDKNKNSVVFAVPKSIEYA